ncbi:MAG: copper resistance protein CopC [Gammaproteobacteria bacterium]|nr:copper resistance protein CopC [Gammaproteobacteria bacterium]
MKRLTVTKLVALIFISVLGTSNVLAHTALTEATPSDGAMLMQAPENLHLKFTETVRLLKVVVTLNEKEIEIDFTPSSTAANQFSVALPKLEHGHYSVAWSVLGADSHNVQGELSFMVGMMEGNHEESAEAHAGNDQHSAHAESNQSSHDH